MEPLGGDGVCRGGRGWVMWETCAILNGAFALLGLERGKLTMKK